MFEAADRAHFHFSSHFKSLTETSESQASYRDSFGW